MKGLRIIIADPDAAFRKSLGDRLTQLGYIVVDEASDGRSALQLIYNCQPDLALINTNLDGRDGLDICDILEGQKISPVILLADYDDYNVLAAALRQWVFGYIVKPVDMATLVPNLEIAAANFRRVVGLEEENKKLKQALETRKLVERAKAALIEALGLTEHEALKFIQKISMDKSLPMKKVALKILTKYGGKQQESY